MIKLVMFRLETTLLRKSLLYGNAVMRVLADREGSVHPSLADATLGLPLHLALRMLAQWSKPELAQAQRDLEKLLVYAYGNAPTNPEVFGATRCLEALKECGIKIALESGLSKPVLDVVTERLGWAGRGLVDAVVPCEDPVAQVGDSLRRAMTVTGVGDPQQVAHVGRSAFDILAAAEVGTRIRALVGEVPAFESLPYTHVIASAVLMPELIKRATPATLANGSPLRLAKAGSQASSRALVGTETPAFCAHLRNHARGDTRAFPS
jgi:phosphoglycolate phosphatase-like HAD superfamily hydrolase